MENVEYGLLISFPDQSESFVLGFEAGILYEQMGKEIGPIEKVLHALNIPLVLKMCATLGWSMEQKPPVDGWVEVTLARSRRANFRVVE